MSKITHYTVVHAHIMHGNKEDLIKKVNSLIKQGWQPLGPTQFFPSPSNHNEVKAFQTMVGYEVSLNEAMKGGGL